MSAAAVVAELRRGPATTGALAETLGMTRNAVCCSIRRAKAEGHEIVNVRGHAGHHDGLYYLAHDRDNPKGRRCAFKDCQTVLSSSNHTRYCRRHLGEVAYLLLLEELGAVLDDLLGTDEQLALLMVGA